MNRCNYNKSPNVLLYAKNTEYSKTFVKTALECQRFGFNFDKMKFRNSCLIKARAMAKDPEIVKYTSISANDVILDNAKEHFTIPQKPNIKNDEINGTGIDLGTSRCCAAVNRKNKIETVALDNQGQRLLPSYVGFDENKIKCGQLVADRLRYFSKYTVFDSKRIIGRKFEDIKINSRWPFKIINTGNGVCIEVETATEISRKNPEQIATALLKQIKQKAEAFQGQKLTNVVITVPATFTELQKCATHSAAVLAGWNIVELLPEPVAAVFAYFIDRPIPNNSTLLLFDLGGGTLDVCVFHVANNEIEILSIDGDSQLGGRDFDNVLIDYFHDRLKTEKGINELGDRKYKLIQDCEKIKEDLSAIDKSWLDVDGYDPSKTGLLTIIQTEFEKLSEALLIRIKNCILSAVNKSSAKDIDKVFFVGGGSRMPMTY
uniref:Heat shock protein 70 n=1 Tax=Panagrolaimus sp. PS1159 TaxID=55785 RepID=A0AC35F076_9BILA